MIGGYLDGFSGEERIYNILFVDLYFGGSGRSLLKIVVWRRDRFFFLVVCELEVWVGRE